MKIKRSSIFFFFIFNVIILTIPVNIYSQRLVTSPSLVLDIIGSDLYYSNSNGFYNPYEIFIYENLAIEDYQLLRIPSVLDPYLHYGGYMANPSLDYDNLFFNYNSYWFPDWNTFFRYNFSLNYPFNSWYGDFYNPGKNQKQSTDKESEEKESTDENPIFNGAAKIITENDNGGIFTFHVGDEFVVYFQIDAWDSPFFSRHRDHWLEEEEIKPENGYGFEKVEDNFIDQWWGYFIPEGIDYNYYYRYKAVQPGKNELLFNCYPLSYYTEGSNAWKWILEDFIFDTFTITINIID